MEEMRMTRPRPDRASAGRQAWTENTVPFRLVPSTWSTASSVMSASRALGKTPALATSTSMPPSRSAATAAIRRQSSRLETSAATNETSPGRSASTSSSSAACRAVSVSRPVIRTRAPLRANTAATPRPMPRVPPVTTTTRPASDVNMSAPSSVRAQVGLGQVAAVPGEARAELGGGRGALVGADPGDQEQPPEQDEGPDLGLVRGGQRAGPPVAGQPAVDQAGNGGGELEEGQPGGTGG